MGPGYPLELASHIAQALRGREDLHVHAGFDRVEIAHRLAGTLGVADADGVWMAVGPDAGGAILGGRFGVAYRRVADPGAATNVLTAAADRALAHGEPLEPSLAEPARRAGRLYLKLMHPQTDALEELARIVAEHDLSAVTALAWRDRNWRPHVVACAAMCLSGDRSSVDAAWMALDRSWASPQIAAALCRVDADFGSRASARLLYADARDAEPLGGWTLGSKSRGALAAMCARPSGEDGAGGAGLARAWSDRMAAFRAR